jgi:HK97 family phage prohead protease
MSEQTAMPAPETTAAPTVTSIEEVVPPVRKFYVAEMKALKNGDIEAYVSTEAEDRVGDIIKAKGWQIENYVRTGAPVLFSHDYAQPPIGKAIDIQVQRKGLWSVTRFHEKTQLSRDLAILARGGDMKSWSVGFKALEEPESRMEGGVFKGYIFSRQELLEYSLVAVPANPEAVSKAIHMAHRGLISKQTAYIFAGPSPLAVEGSGTASPSTQDPTDEHLAKMAGMKFLKRFYDGKT